MKKKCSSSKIGLSWLSVSTSEETRRIFKRNLHKSMRFQAKQPEDFRRTS